MHVAIYKIIHQNRGKEPGEHYFEFSDYVNYLGSEITWSHQNDGIYTGELASGDFPENISVTRCTVESNLLEENLKFLDAAISGNKCTIDTGLIMPEDPYSIIDLYVEFTIN